MANAWMQFFKDALYTAEQFFNEKKPGQYPAVNTAEDFGQVFQPERIFMRCSAEFAVIFGRTSMGARCKARVGRGFSTIGRGRAAKAVSQEHSTESPV